MTFDILFLKKLTLDIEAKLWKQNYYISITGRTEIGL